MLGYRMDLDNWFCVPLYNMRDFVDRLLVCQAAIYREIQVIICSIGELY